MVNPSTPVGVLVNNPSLAPSPAESEVTNNPSAVVASGAGAAPTTNASSEPASVSDACESFVSAGEPSIEALVAALPAETLTKGKRVARVSPRRLGAIPLLSALLRKYPSLSADHTPADIDAPMADAASCAPISQVLTNANAKVANTINVRQTSAWSVASEILSLAEKKAAGDPDLARDFAPIKAMLANGTRTNTAPVTAAKLQAVAARQTARANTANAKAAEATAKANALQHGTGDAVITQPAPSAPTTPSGK